MHKLSIYLDNCCYNRPFDDLSHVKVKNEAAAKMYIQTLVKYKSVLLCTSYMLSFEVSENPYAIKREHIQQFISEHSDLYVSQKREKEIMSLANNIIAAGIKLKDAVHIACSVIAECDYFITTDKRLFKFETESIKIVNPIDFVNMWRDLND